MYIADVMHKNYSNINILDYDLIIGIVVMLLKTYFKNHIYA